jgi:capsular exopolysaccharide synthesis family protein
MIPPNPHDLNPVEPVARPNYLRPLGNGNGNGHPSGVYLPVPVPPERPPALPPGLTSAMTPQGLLKALKRRWGRALFLGLLFAAAAAVGAFFVMPRSKYRAETVLQVLPARDYVVTPINDPKDQGGAFQRMQLFWVKSRLVLNDALKRPRVAELPLIKERPDPVEWLEKELRADYTLGPEFLTISMSGDDPEQLRVIVNAVAETYKNEVVFKELSERMEKIKKLQELARQFDAQLKDRRNFLRDLTLRMGAGRQNAPVQQRLTLEQLAMAEKELIRLRHEAMPHELLLAQLEAQLKTLEASQIPEDAIKEALEKDPVVVDLRKRIAEIDSQLEADRLKLKEDVYIQWSKRLVESRNKLNDEVERRKLQIRPVIAKELREKLVGETRAKIEQAKATRDFRKKMEEQLELSVKKYAEIAQRLNQGVVDMEVVTDDLQAVEQLAKNVATNLATLEAEKKAPPRVRRMEGDTEEEAEKAIRIIPPSDQRQKQLMVVALAAVVALGAVFFVVSWWEWRAKRIDGVDEVMHGLGMTVFGTLPAWRNDKGRRLGGGKSYRDLHWQSLFTESVDATRTMLLHAARQEGLRVVMVTSAVSGEGKTSLSTHLATSLARAGRRTLLVDCDLRNPAAHRLFDLPLTPGVSELLRGEVALAEAVKPTTVNGLWMVTAGRCDDRALQALAQDDIRKIFDQLKEQYEFLIVDSSPVLPVADSLLLGQHVDAVLLSILRDVSRIPMVYTAYQRLNGLGIRMLGAVVNGTREETQGYGYSYGYRYGEQPALEGDAADEPAGAEATEAPAE